MLIIAAVLRPNGGTWPNIPIEITVSEKGKLQAREFPAYRWPTFCPQRHINEGGYLCLGMSEVPIVKDDESAKSWWRVLVAHLSLQFTADATRVWPPHLEWDHGSAGDTQEKMEKLAQKQGLLEAVRQAHFYSQGWLAGELPRLTKTGDRLVNGRAPCPRGCTMRKHPILRRSCEKRDLVYWLVKLERLKRAQSASFWDSVKGKPCCGQMKNCPLRKES
jgi:hypothetical protein